jgi:GDP-D-mannose 3', 5'-epimerase
MPERILVTGAGGFIGSHMVKYLKEKGCWVRGVDIKKPEFDKTAADDFLLLDLRYFENCKKASEGMDQVYNFAANMGGIGFISFNNSEIMYDNVCINANMARACKENKVKRVFYSSSACVYRTDKQRDPNITALKEEDAYPGDPDNEYGWEKLYSERLYKAFGDEGFFKMRIARFHNIYGPYGTYDGGREKAPAATCRKIAKAKDGDEVEIWGDGQQTRSFCYIDDCVEGVYRLMMSDYENPVNIGSAELTTIDNLYDIVSKIAGKKIIKKHDPSKPQGVRGRNSDNTLCKKVLRWEPKVFLEEGLEKTYHWVKEMVLKNPA